MPREVDAVDGHEFVARGHVPGDRHRAERHEARHTQFAVTLICRRVPVDAEAAGVRAGPARAEYARVG